MIPSLRLVALQLVHHHISIRSRSAYIRSSLCLPNTFCNSMQLGVQRSPARGTTQLTHSLKWIFMCRTMMQPAMEGAMHRCTCRCDTAAHLQRCIVWLSEPAPAANLDQALASVRDRGRHLHAFRSVHIPAGGEHPPAQHNCLAAQRPSEVSPLSFRGCSAQLRNRHVAQARLSQASNACALWRESVNPRCNLHRQPALPWSFGWFLEPY